MIPCGFLVKERPKIPAAIKTAQKAKGALGAILTKLFPEGSASMFPRDAMIITKPIAVPAYIGPPVRFYDHRYKKDQPINLLFYKIWNNHAQLP
jgi:hypothetical protein